MQYIIWFSGNTERGSFRKPRLDYVLELENLSLNFINMRKLAGYFPGVALFTTGLWQRTLWNLELSGQAGVLR